MTVAGGPSDQQECSPITSPSHFLSELVNTGGQDGWARKASPPLHLTQKLGRGTPKALVLRNGLPYTPNANGPPPRKLQKTSPESGVSNQLLTAGSSPGKGPAAEISLTANLSLDLGWPNSEPISVLWSPS